MITRNREAWRQAPASTSVQTPDRALDHLGFLSLAHMLEVEIPIPDHTTLSRRVKKLGGLSLRAVASHRPIHLLIDSTGLRIHVGNLRKPPKKRAWRKLHLAVDATTGEIVASDLTSRRTRIDGPIGPLRCVSRAFSRLARCRQMSQMPLCVAVIHE